MWTDFNFFTVAASHATAEESDTDPLIKYTPIHQPNTFTAVTQFKNETNFVINKNVQFVIHMRIQINCSMYFNCFFSERTRDLSRAFTQRVGHGWCIIQCCWVWPSVYQALLHNIAHTSNEWQQQHSQKRISKLGINASSKNTRYIVYHSKNSSAATDLRGGDWKLYKRNCICISGDIIQQHIDA